MKIIGYSFHNFNLWFTGKEEIEAKFFSHSLRLISPFWDFLSKEYQQTIFEIMSCDKEMVLDYVKKHK